MHCLDGTVPLDERIGHGRGKVWRLGGLFSGVHPCAIVDLSESI